MQKTSSISVKRDETSHCKQILDRWIPLWRRTYSLDQLHIFELLDIALRYRTGHSVYTTVLVNLLECFQLKELHLLSLRQQHLLSMPLTPTFLSCHEVFMRLQEKLQRCHNILFAVMPSIPQRCSTMLIDTVHINTGVAGQYVNHSQMACTSGP